jgi:hypothetical protein
MGNKVRIDMGYSFGFVFRVFRGHVRKNDRMYFPEIAVRETGSEGPNKHGRTLSLVSFQPEDRL